VLSAPFSKTVSISAQVLFTEIDHRVAKFGCSDYWAKKLVAYAKCDWDIEEPHETRRVTV